MGRELRRLLIPPARLAETVDLLPAEVHYLRRVLRCRSGSRVAVIDGCGHLWSAMVEGAERLRLEQGVRSPLEQRPPSRPSLELALGLPRREVDVVWRMATELGADRLQPLMASRSLERGRPPMERWNLIVREATEQCERLWLPRLEEICGAGSWLARPPRGLGLLATTREPELPRLAELLMMGSSLAEPAQVSLAIGPEGGWTPEEEAAAVAAGWRRVGLGEEILRTSTAAVSGLAALAAWRLSCCASSPRPST